MKIFLDSANLRDLENSLSRGYISGVTTNPSLLAKEPKANFLGHINKMVDILKSHDATIPLSIEVFAKDVDGMLRQADEFRQAVDYPNLNIKIPIGWDELRAISTLTKRGIDVNCTAIFTEGQAVMAADAGARFVSIFFCRLKDIGGDPVKVISNTRKMLDKAHHGAEIICGSMRAPSDVADAHLAGGHIVTAGPKILEDMAGHPQTDRSVAGFMKDFEAWISE